MQRPRAVGLLLGGEGKRDKKRKEKGWFLAPQK